MNYIVNTQNLISYDHLSVMMDCQDFLSDYIALNLNRSYLVI